MSAFNEDRTVGKVLEKIKDLDYIDEIIVVDNGSTDSTHKVLLSAQKTDSRIKVFKIEKNKGLGLGLRLAIENTTGDIVVRQDADFEYDPAELINLVEIIDKDLADVVYGSRMLVRKAHRVHYYFNYIANKIITMFSNIVTNLFLSDVETAAKAFKGDIVRNIRWRSKGFEIENEMTIKLKWMGCTFYEVPYSYYGRQFSEGKKIRPFDGIKAMLYIVYFSIPLIFNKKVARTRNLGA